MISILLCIFLFILSAIWALISGITEGILYSRKGSDAFKWNIHRVYSIQRVTIGLMLIVCYFCGDFRLNTFIYLIGSCILAWNLFHDGAYYETRRRIDTPEYHWYSDTPTTTAILNFSFTLRFSLAVAGLMLLLLTIARVI